ncbi:MAG: hypothetical protein ACXU86_25400 [Archangium sp.]
MKFAFCVEDVSDKEVFRVLLSRVWKTEVVAEDLRLRTGGWTMALKLAPTFATAAYHRGLDGAVFAIDNDGAVPHLPAHQDAIPGCRLCELRAAAQTHVPLSWPRPDLPPLRYLFAVPVRTLETWLLLAHGHDFKGQSESLGKDQAGRAKLKKWLYGMEHPDRETMRRAAVPIAESLDIDALAKVSPSFEAFLSQLR